MDVGILVEQRSGKTIITHGIAAGIVGGLALGLVQFVIAAAHGEDAVEPFRLVSSLVLGEEAIAGDSPTYSTALVIVVGALLHFGMSALFGVAFMGLLALLYQLSARTPLLIAYGFVFGFFLWEINFMAIMPAFFPDLKDEFGLSGQVWKGIVAYTLVYGPVLACYVAATRRGVLTDWRNRSPGTKRGQST